MTGALFTSTPPMHLHGMVLNLKKAQGQLYLYLYQWYFSFKQF